MMELWKQSFLAHWTFYGWEGAVFFFNLTDHSSPDLNLLRLRALFFVVRFAS